MHAMLIQSDHPLTQQRQGGRLWRDWEADRVVRTPPPQHRARGDVWWGEHLCM